MSAVDRPGVAQDPAPKGAAPREAALQEAYYLASQWKLIWRKFSRHKLALVGMIVLGLLYLMAAFGGFVSPYDPYAFSDHPFTPPQRVRFVDADGRLHPRPFVYLLDQSLNMRTLAREYAENRTEVGSRTGAPTVGSGGKSNHFRVGPQSGSHDHVSSPRLLKRSMRFSRTTLSCLLHVKGYAAYRVGSAFAAATGHRTR